MARRPKPVDQGNLMSQQQLEEWLGAVKAFVREHASLPRNRDIKALISDWVPQVTDDTMILRSGRLAASDLKADQNLFRVLQHVLNDRYLPRCFGAGRRYRIAKPPHRDYYVLEPVPMPAPQILLDKSYDGLRRRIQALDGVREVTVVQHSGKSTSDMIGELIRAGVRVDLYLQDPATAVNARQALKIEAEKKDARAFHGLDSADAGASRPGRLRIFKYAVPATIRAVIAGPADAPLLISWGSYYYYRTDDPEAQPSGMNVLGHLLPQVVVEAGAEGFDVLAGMMQRFLRDLAAGCAIWDTLPDGSRDAAAR